MRVLGRVYHCHTYTLGTPDFDRKVTFLLFQRIGLDLKELSVRHPIVSVCKKLCEREREERVGGEG